MFSGNWLHKLAVRGFLIGVILFAGNIALSAEQPQEPSVKTEQGKDASREKGEASPLFVTPEKQKAPALDKRPDDEANYRARADLEAQRRMAVAAEQLKDLTNTQIWVSAVEVALISITVFFAAWAAIAASQAAKAAYLTIDFMRKAERPFFVVGELHPRDFAKAIKAFRALPGKWSKSDRYVVEVAAIINNVGTRPGIIRSVHFDYCWQPPPKKQPEIETLGEWAGKQSIARDGKSPTIVGSFVFSADFINGFMELGEHLCVHGFVRYSDVHGTTWRSGFSFEYLIPPTLGKESVFIRSSPTSYWYDIEEKNQEDEPQGLWKRLLGVLAT